MMIVWAVIAIIVAVIALLIFLEIDFGYVAAGVAAAIGAASYFLAQLVAKSAVLVYLPVRPSSELETAALIAAVLLVIGAVVGAYFLGRHKGKGETR